MVLMMNVEQIFQVKSVQEQEILQTLLIAIVILLVLVFCPK